MKISGHPNMHTILAGMSVTLSGMIVLPDLSDDQRALVSDALSQVTQTQAAVAADPYHENVIPALQQATAALQQVFGDAE